ncbi:MAG TPA: hypothetical protein VI408_12075 [Gaiellaceae bacterium]
MAPDRSGELLDLARRIVDALPADVVADAAVTGSVSRGAADQLSDIEMLLLVDEELPLEACYAHADVAGLEQLDTWGPQEGPTRRVFGYRDGVPVELIWWPRAFGDASVERLLDGDVTGSADAIVHAVPLRTTGVVEAWRARLTPMPAAVVRAVCEDAALMWGGFAPEGYLTIARSGETPSRLEYMVADVVKMVRILYAVNGLWPPTTKRLASRAETLSVKPERFGERVEAALEERDPRRALRDLVQLQVETAALAPDGPNVLRARSWLPRVVALLS